jgi:hypothetical protein
VQGCLEPCWAPLSDGHLPRGWWGHRAGQPAPPGSLYSGLWNKDGISIIAWQNWSGNWAWALLISKKIMKQIFCVKNLLKVFRVVILSSRNFCLSWFSKSLNSVNTLIKFPELSLKKILYYNFWHIFQSSIKKFSSQAFDTNLGLAYAPQFIYVFKKILFPARISSNDLVNFLHLFRRQSIIYFKYKNNNVPKCDNFFFDKLSWDLMSSWLVEVAITTTWPTSLPHTATLPPVLLSKQILQYFAQEKNTLLCTTKSLKCSFFRKTLFLFDAMCGIVQVQ